MGDILDARGSAATNNHAFSDGAKTPDTSVNDETNTELQNYGENVLPYPENVVADEIIGSMDDDGPRAFNLYRNKKLISHGMMNVALFSANANQLRYVFETGNGNAVYVICIVLLLVSIFLQILVGVTLLLSARYNVTDCGQRKMAFRLGNYVIVGIFLVTVVNIFITSFGGPTVIPPTTTLTLTPTTTLPPSTAAQWSENENSGL